ncbi:MAG: alanine--tRNA ligase-related protein [Brotaphodocola sp.]
MLIRSKKEEVTAMTEKLYYQDAHLESFTAQVLSCVWDEARSYYAVVLDRTGFFPEEGGQYADGGTLNGVNVEDVREKDDIIVHYLKQPLETGMNVTGQIDYQDRFVKMQQHSGEHIVSGLVHRHFGYDNVGFHLGKELVTMDFNGVLTEEQLRQIEWEANEAVTKNLQIQVTYPAKDELGAMEYRSKKELSGLVRIVTVPGYDVCACCAPHVERTGEIGMIRLVDAVKYKGGTRVTMVCGFRALQDYRCKERNVREISRQLSAKPYEVADAVKRLQGEVQQMKDKLYRFQMADMERKLEEIPQNANNYFLFEADMEKNAARKFVDSGKEKCSGLCGLFIGTDQDGYQYILGSKCADLKAVLKEFHEAFPGKGGGKGEMVQGIVMGECKKIKMFFEAES